MEILVFSVINIFTFLLYGYDKIMAIKDGWRASEKMLLSASLLGGIGAMLGMSFFRHKTKKMKFKIFVPICFIISMTIFTYIRG